jgi:AcrR family transcriptional regulator
VGDHVPTPRSAFSFVSNRRDQLPKVAALLVTTVDEAGGVKRSEATLEEAMLDLENRTLIKRIPQQERSQARFEAVLKAALHLFASRGYENTSMREIAREAKMPIATVYQYFPMKLAIVREMWTRYTSTITETLEAGIRNFLKNGTDDSNHLNEIIIDKMAELQAANPAFIEIWSCVTASIDLRALNVEDTLNNARAIADALQQRYPECDPSAVFDRALIAIEAASATTRLALTLPEPHRARVLFSLKATLSLLLDPMTLDKRKGLLGEKRSRRASTDHRGRPNGKVATPKTVPFSR